MNIRCTLPNASEVINGVKFFPDGKGMLSEEVDIVTANRFLAIPGYEVVDQDDIFSLGTAESLPAADVAEPVIDLADVEKTDPVQEVAVDTIEETVSKKKK